MSEEKRKKKPPVIAPEETIEYLQKIEKILDDKESLEEEETEFFVENVFKEIKKSPKAIVMDPECSRVIEKLLRISTDAQLNEFLDLLFEILEEVCFHKNGSHVVQTLLCLLPNVIQNEMNGIDSNFDSKNKNKKTTQELFLGVCDLMMDGWANLAFDSYASHIFRVILNILSGRKQDFLSRSNSSMKYNIENNNRADYGKKKQRSKVTEVMDEDIEPIYNVPQQFPKMITKITSAFLSQINELDFISATTDPVVSPILQLLLISNAQNEKMLDVILKRFFATKLENEEEEESKEKDSESDSEPKNQQEYHHPSDPKFMDSLIHHQVGSHLIQRIIQVCPPQTYNKLYADFFRNKLGNLCSHPVANFVVNSLIHSVKSEPQFGLIFEELSTISDQIMNRNRGTIAKEIVLAGLRFPNYQKQIMQFISQGFHANSPNEKHRLFELILYFVKYEYLENCDKKPNQNGASILQALFSYQPNICKSIVDSMLSCPKEEIIKWSYDAIGSRGIEGFFRGKSVDVKAKAKSLKFFEGKFCELSMDKFGSHVVDACWGNLDMIQKEKIVAELVHKDKELLNNFYGKFIHRNCKVDSYKLKKEEWREKEESSMRKKEMFDDFLQEAEQAKVEKKKSQTMISKLETEYDKNMVALGFGRKAKKDDSDDDDDVEEEPKKKPEEKKRKRELDEIDQLFKQAAPNPTKKSKQEKKEKKEKKQKKQLEDGMEEKQKEEKIKKQKEQLKKSTSEKPKKEKKEKKKFSMM